MSGRLLASEAAEHHARPAPPPRVAPHPQLPDSAVAFAEGGEFAAVPLALSGRLSQFAAADYRGRRVGQCARRLRRAGADEHVRAEGADCGKQRVPMCGRAESERSRVGAAVYWEGGVSRRVASSDQHCLLEGDREGIDDRGRRRVSDGFAYRGWYSRGGESRIVPMTYLKTMEIGKNCFSPSSTFCLQRWAERLA